MKKHVRYIVLALLPCLFVFNAAGSENLEDAAVAFAPLGPIIKVYGNGYLIENGASNPVRYNLTDFEFEYVNERHTHWFTLENAGDENLVLSGPLYVSVVGTDREHFSVRSQPSVTTLTPGSTTTFAIAFEPEYYGEVGATVQIYSNDSSHSPYSFLIQGGDDDDNHVRWYASCGIAEQGNHDWLLPIILLIAVMVMKRVTFSSAS